MTDPLVCVLPCTVATIYGEQITVAVVGDTVVINGGTLLPADAIELSIALARAANVVLARQPGTCRQAGVR